MGGEKKVFANGDTRNSSPKHVNSPCSSIYLKKKKKKRKSGPKFEMGVSP